MARTHVCQIHYLSTGALSWPCVPFLVRWRPVWCIVHVWMCFRCYLLWVCFFSHSTVCVCACILIVSMVCSVYIYIYIYIIWTSRLKTGSYSTKPSHQKPEKSLPCLLHCIHDYCWFGQAEPFVRTTKTLIKRRLETIHDHFSVSSQKRYADLHVHVDMHAHAGMHTRTYPVSPESPLDFALPASLLCFFTLLVVDSESKSLRDDPLLPSARENMHVRYLRAHRRTLREMNHGMEDSALCIWMWYAHLHERNVWDTSCEMKVCIYTCIYIYIYTYIYTYMYTHAYTSKRRHVRYWDLGQKPMGGTRLYYPRHQKRSCGCIQRTMLF